MTTNSSFDRHLAAWLDRDAQERIPDHLTEVLVVTRAARQRPWWSSPERWLPVDVPVQLQQVAAPTQRLLLLIVLLLAALLALWVVVGQQPRFPLYGLARNGVTIEDDGHDLFVVDPATGTKKPLVAGPDDEFWPYFAHDGSRFVFGRQTALGLFAVVADTSGANVKVVAGPVVGFDSLDWSGDARSLAMIAEDAKGHAALSVIDTRTGTSRTLDLGGLLPATVSWLPPRGDEILFRGQGFSQDSTAVFAIRPDGTGLRALTPGGQNDAAYSTPLASPDGSRIAYADWEGQTILRLHVFEIASGRDWMLPGPTATSHREPVAWSPDGRSLLIVENTLDGPAPSTGVGQLILVEAGGPGSALALGPAFPLAGDDSDGQIRAEFSPDGSTVFMVHGQDHQLWTIPIEGSAATTTAWPSEYLPAVQRLAP